MDEYSQFLKQQAQLNPKIFWDIKNIQTLSDAAIVERLLSHGNMDQLRAIAKDKDHFTKIYNGIKTKERKNLSSRAINFVDLYIQNNA